MKIKEKGLTGRAANLRKESMASGPGKKGGFNAFREMGQFQDKKGNNAGQKGKPQEVWLEFLGQRIRVHDEDGGSIKQEDIPFVKGATLKFEGVEGDVSFDEIKVCMRVVLLSFALVYTTPREARLNKLYVFLPLTVPLFLLLFCSSAI